MMIPLTGKSVLYVAPRFFGYEREIADELVRRGAQVDFLLDRPFDTPLMAAVTRFRRGWIIGAADRYYQRQLAHLSEKKYDLVFVINGQTLSPHTLQAWRGSYKRAKFVLYMWDSFGNRSSATDNLKFFDHCFSFDKNDSHKFNLVFRPLFFSSGFERARSAMPTIDISFVGTAHTDRYAIVAAISKQCGNDANMFYYLFLQAKWVFWAYKLINPAFRGAEISQFNFKPLGKKAVQKIFSDSRAILDIEHPQQTGLTMRTLETIGARKKLITTNKNIRGYDFFSAKNICIIDRCAPRVPAGFVREPYEDIPAAVFQRYRLEGWLDEILALANV